MTSSNSKPDHVQPGRRLKTAAAVIVFAPLWLQGAVGLAAQDPDWAPQSSERLVKLPATYLKKAIDKDFANSSLASALAESEQNVKLKTQTLQDLQGAIDRADGELRVELQHQFLAEKQDFLKQMARNRELRRKRAETKIRIYERLLGRLKQSSGAMGAQQVALVQKQERARQRFESSLSKVDAKLFQSALAAESRYARDYAKNVAAVERLVRAINAHPMNEQSKIDGTVVTKEDFIRKLIADNQADLSILDQEQSLLAFMAKLVSLDALALSEQIEPSTGDDQGGETQKAGLSDAVDYFVSR